VTGTLNQGNSPITTYKIYWDQGTPGSTQIYKLSTLNQTSINITSLTTGTTYGFTISASNLFGEGPVSTTVYSVIAAIVPTQMSAPVITQTD
jgi:hypothetical protein